MRPIAAHIALFSIEPWDQVWRRNQQLASRLVRLGHVKRISFIEPPRGGLALRSRRWNPVPGIEVVTPPMVVPRRFGGHRVIGAWQRRHLNDAEILWVNDPVAGATLLGLGLPTLYDVTDDWRSVAHTHGDDHRIVAAEDRLAAQARIVVCSQALATRWEERYATTPVVVQNGVDLEAVQTAPALALSGAGPHAIYVGTLHENRIDVDLVLDLARQWPGSVHLVGPNHLSERTIARLHEAGVELVGPVPSADVASWLNAADVLICPHLVDDFTLSLDAIKSHEYLATDRPVVATPSSGFQSIHTAGLWVAGGSDFLPATISAVRSGPYPRSVAIDWDQRADEFAQQLKKARRTDA